MISIRNWLLYRVAKSRSKHIARAFAKLLNFACTADQRSSLALEAISLSRQFNGAGDQLAAVALLTTALVLDSEIKEEAAGNYFGLINAVVQAAIDAEDMEKARRYLKLLGLSAATGEIVSVREFCEETSGKYIEIFASRQISEPELRFFKEEFEPDNLKGQTLAIPCYYAEIENCSAYANANVIMVKQRIVYDLFTHPLADCFWPLDFAHRPSPQPYFRSDKKPALLCAPISPVARYPSGLQMFGAQANQYGHWLSEYMPRMVIFDSDACGNHFPIVVDEGMPQSHYDSIELLNSRGRKVITLRKPAAHFDVLGVAPVPAPFPGDIRTGSKVYDVIWPADVLRALKSKICAEVRRREGRPIKQHRRLFVARKGYSGRKLLNEDEIAHQLTRCGFEIVQPETLSFVEQVLIFMQASVVVGSCNSGLSNSLFCASGTKVIGLIHREPTFNFRGHASFIQAGGAEVTFLRGETPPGQTGHPFHKSYRIDPAQLLESIEAH